jgi:branched-chain amino acid transport system substrate-binding protein
MTKRNVFMSAAAAAALSLLANAASADIVIAVVGPMTGQNAAFGEQFRRGAEAAVADINAAGGVNGEQLVLEVGDDACDPKQAVSVANQMANKGAVFVAGHYCSGSSIPASDVYNEAGILQISPASTNPDFTERGLANVFRTCSRDDKQGDIAGNYLLKTYAGKRIAFVHDKSAYGKGLADATRAAYQAGGGQDAMYEAITAGERDYSALISKVKAENIDVLYYGGYHSESGMLARQLRQAGLGTQLISGDATVTQEFWSISGDAGEGTMMTFPPDPRNNPEAAPVVEKFKGNGIDPEGYTLYTYAAIQVFAQAAANTKSTALDDLTGALHKDTFKTVLGEIRFDEKGDVVGPTYVFYKWHAGSYGQM